MIGAAGAAAAASSVPPGGGVTPPPDGGGGGPPPDPGGGGGGGGGTPVNPTVTVTPSTITVHKAHGGTATFTFSSVVAGGVGPFTYLWDEGDGSRTGPTVTFSKHAPADDEIDGIVHLTVTGSDGGVGHGSGEWFALGF